MTFFYGGAFCSPLARLLSRREGVRNKNPQLLVLAFGGSFSKDVVIFVVFFFCSRCPEKKKETRFCGTSRKVRKVENEKAYLFYPAVFFFFFCAIIGKRVMVIELT